MTTYGTRWAKECGIEELPHVVTKSGSIMYYSRWRPTDAEASIPTEAYEESLNIENPIMTRRVKTR